MRYLLPAALTVLLMSASAYAQTVGQIDFSNVHCSTSSSDPNGHVSWPVDDPLWEFDYYRPANGQTSRGTGVELRNVFYDGKKIFERAHAPVINVEYDASGCSCFRDWQDSEVQFEANGEVDGTTCLAAPDAGTVISTCETGQGGDVGDFTGVAFEDYGDELVVSSHMSAGWYRYRMKWHFYTDGRIWPEYSFAAASATCTDQDHRHHTYWRFDFDLEDTPENDVIRQHSTANPDGDILITEADGTWGDPDDGIYWSVIDESTETGYTLVPGEADLELPIDNFSQTDFLALVYQGNEIDDGSFSCPIDYSEMMNEENLEGEDIVFWYRTGALHEGGNPWACDIVGPMLTPVDFTIGTEGVPGGEGGIELDAAYPNPLSPTATVRFRVGETQDVTLSLYDALGRRVQTVFSGTAVKDRYETVTIDASGLAAGTYIVHLEGQSISETTRVVVAP